MIFSEKFEKAIYATAARNYWDIYNAKYPKLMVPGNLQKCLVKEPKFELNNPYRLLPKREFFYNSRNLKSEVLDQKILNMVEVCKPVVTFFLEREVLNEFILRESDVDLSLTYHPKYKKDPKPVKTHNDSVSYTHFIMVLESLEQYPLDKFV
ncbi:MAG: hypothetical protein QXR60_01230 [Candidatus Nanoarchaeia archaeon]